MLVDLNVNDSRCRAGSYRRPTLTMVGRAKIRTPSAGIAIFPPRNGDAASVKPGTETTKCQTVMLYFRFPLSPRPGATSKLNQSCAAAASGSAFPQLRRPPHVWWFIRRNWTATKTFRVPYPTTQPRIRGERRGRRLPVHSNLNAAAQDQNQRPRPYQPPPPSTTRIRTTMRIVVRSMNFSNGCFRGNRSSR